MFIWGLRRRNWIKVNRQAFRSLSYCSCFEYCENSHTRSRVWFSFGCLFFAFGRPTSVGHCRLSRVYLQVVVVVLMLLLLIKEIRLDALLVLEYLLCQSLLLQKVLLSLISHLVIDLNLVLCHFDIFFDNADTFLLFRSLEAEIVLISRSLCCITVTIVFVFLSLTSWVVLDRLTQFLLLTFIFFKLI